MGKIVFVLGGARSGKSRFAQERAAAAGPRVTYIATAEPGDAEMAVRIAHHRADRPADWETIEEPQAISAALRRCAPESDAVLLDCLTLFVSNLLAAPGADPEAAGAQAEREVAALLDIARHAEATTILVSNEVGLGLVPEYPLGRAFRDVAGRIHQRVAAEADEVHFLVAGIPLRVKG